MKRLIFSAMEKVNMQEVKDKAEEIRKLFDKYLDSYPLKTTKTKHGVMGPVGKILQMAKTGKWDSQALTGYALNIHMMNPEARGISEEARRSLEEGIEKLIALMGDVPFHIQDRAIELIDYGLYYQRRKKEYEDRERTRLDFIVFLKDKYKTEEALKTSWQDNHISFESVYLFGKKSNTFKKSNQTKKEDMEAFWQHMKEKGKEEAIELLSEEE